MLSGLEAVEIKSGKVFGDDHFSGRIDSDFFKKDSVAAVSRIEKLKHVRLAHALTDIAYGLHLQPNYTETGLRFIRGLNLCDTMLHRKILKVGDFVSHYHLLKRGDVLIVRTGNVGDVGYIDNSHAGAAFGSFTIRLRVNRNILAPDFFAVFLESKYGRCQTNRIKTGMSQPNLSIPNLGGIAVPVLSMQREIAQVAALARRLRYQAKAEYEKAEKYLLGELGLANVRPENGGIAIEKVTPLMLDRLDAEFYCAPSSQMREVMSAKGVRFAPMAEIFEIKTTLFTPEEGLDYKYIELADIGDFGEIRSFSRHRGKDLPDRARRIVAAGDVVLPLVEGSVSSCALIDDAHDGFLCSTGFAVLSPRKTISAAALVLCKSVYMRKVLKATASGTILTSVNPKRFGDIPAPILATRTQKQIEKMIRKAADLRRESNRLLAVAKRAVEIAIEKGEAEALRFIEKSRAD